MFSIKRKCRDHLESLDAHSCRISCSSAFCCVHHIKSIILRYDILLAPCTYPVVMVHDRWDATGIATLSLHLILLSASLRALQNFNPATQRYYSPNASFVGPFFSLLALFLVKSSWQALMILIHAQTTLTCVSLL